ncbi:MAG: hypothetical protein AAF693_09940 [Bacteroidota bacterium]
MRKLLGFIILFGVGINGFTQSEEVYSRLKGLTIQSNFPENLLKTRSVVLYKVTPKKRNPLIRGDWQSLATVIQPMLKKSGIDGVLHYHIEDVLSGAESYNTLLDYFDDRDLKNAVFVEENHGEFSITITDLQDRQFLIKMGQPAWQIQGTDLSNMLNNLYRATANAGLEKENLLILETPEYGEMISSIKAKRNEFYDLNFSSEKLAVPIEKDTSKIRMALSNYPFRWGFVDGSTPEKELRTQGYQYILYYINTIGKSAKQLLEYNITDLETDYISEMMVEGKLTVESYNVNTPIYKYYIKHIYSGNVFVGKRWDAAPQKAHALENYILNLRNELVKN